MHLCLTCAVAAAASRCAQQGGWFLVSWRALYPGGSEACLSLLPSCILLLPSLTPI
jgi:uncharacterized membrane protein